MIKRLSLINPKPVCYLHTLALVLTPQVLIKIGSLIPIHVAGCQIFDDSYILLNVILKKIGNIIDSAFWDLG